jgi:hypothetical protein
MQAPPPIPGIPPGLEYLMQLDQLLVHQQVEMFEGIFHKFKMIRLNNVSMPFSIVQCCMHSYKLLLSCREPAFKI